MAQEKTFPGQRLYSTPIAKSAFQNKLVDVVNAWDRGLLLNRSQSKNGSESPTDIVKVRNGTGGALAKGNVVQLGAAILSKKSNRTPWFECSTPTEGSNPNAYAKYAIMREPSPEGKIKQAQIGGVCLAWVNVAAAGHTHAAAKDGSLNLESDFNGPIELLNPSGTGLQLIFVRLSQPASTSYIILAGEGGIPARDGATPGSATAAIYRIGDMSGELEDTGYTETVYNLTEVAVPEGSFCRAVRDSSREDLWVEVPFLGLPTEPGTYIITIGEGGEVSYTTLCSEDGLKGFDNYVGDAVQLLGHDAMGNCRWYTVTTCT